jgi:hypothetical protein
MRSNELAPPWAGAAWDGRKIWGDRGATAKAEPAPAEPAPPWAGAAWDGRKTCGSKELAALGSNEDWSDLLAEGGRIWADFKAKDKAKAAAEKPVPWFEDPWHDLVTAATLKRWGSQQAMNDTAMRA